MTTETREADSPFSHLPAAWRQCIEQFLLTVRDRSGSQSSYTTYRSYLVCFFRFCNKPPDEVSRTDVLNWIQSPATARRNNGGEASASTKNQRRCVLTSLFQFATLYEVDGQPLYTKALPTRGIRDLKKRLAYRAMSQQDLAAFFHVLPAADTVKGARDRALFLTYLFTAKRRCEISRLKWGDIEQSTIREKSGESHQGRIFRYHSKGHSRETKASELPLPAWVAIQHYLEVSGRLATIRGDEYVFTSSWRGEGQRDSEKPSMPLNADYVGQLFKQYVMKAGLNPSYTVHCLRHTSARNRLQGGQNLFDLMETLGHQDISTTWRYAKQLEGTHDTGAKLLESRFAFLSQ